jgi:hypothetical protein
LSDSCGFVDLGRPLWREDGSAVFNCYWPSPAQSFSGPSPIGVVAIFYCLRFETSLFVASYNLQGHGGGIRLRLHTGYNSLSNLSLSPSLILRPPVSRPVCLGIKHPFGAYDQILITVRQLRVCWCGAFSLTRGRVCRLQLLLILASAVILGTIFSVSDLRLPFSSPPTTRRVTVEVLDTGVLTLESITCPPFYNFETNRIYITISKSSCIIACLFVVTDTRFSEPLSSNRLFRVYPLPRERVLIS